jgi:hypothetical protein
MRNRPVAALVILLLLAWAAPASAGRWSRAKEARRAQLLGHEAEQVESSACAEDPEGDAVDADALDEPGGGRAAAGDIVRWCAAYGDELVLRLRTADPTDPREDPSWAGFTTAVWLIDVDADDEPDFQAEYGYDFFSGNLAVRVLRSSGEEEVRCEVGASFRGGELVSGRIGRPCFGGKAELAIAAGMIYDTDPADDEAVMTFDDTPFALHVRGADVEPGTAQRDVRRISGGSRYDTAAALSRETFPNGALRVYLIRADQAADMAGAAGLSAQGPLLPVPPCGAIPQVILDEIRRLAPMEIVAVGGPEAVCEAVVAQAAAA